MKRDDIIRMAHEAGILEYGFPVGERVAGELERFADLVSEAEREECAKACATIDVFADFEPSDVIAECQAAIRARSTP